MTAPRIGLTMNYRQMENALERAYLDRGYLDLLQRHGAIPIPIAPSENTGQLLSLLKTLDGLIFTGGLDLNPQLWGEELNKHTCLLHPRRQTSELLIYRLARKRELPILGICLGIQLMAVAESGSLYQHLPDEPGRVDHGCEERTTEHEVIIDKDSRLYQWLGRESVPVPSCHHQGVRAIGQTLRAAAVARDGVIEALEPTDTDSFLIACQWHPERDADRPISEVILTRFFETARARCC